MDSSQNQNTISNDVPTDEIDLLALIGTIWRGKWWIVLCSILTTVLGLYYLISVATPMYPARAIVALETQKSNVVDIESVLSGGGGGSEEVNTQVEIIRSRNTTTKLVDRLNLVDDPEFNPELRDPNPYHPVTFVNSLLGVESPAKTEEEIENNVIDNVTAQISVSNIRKSLVFSINATTENPDKSALIANTLAEIYIQDALDVKFQATEHASKWLSGKSAELKQELEASELLVRTFSSKTQLVNEDSLALLSRQLKDMRQRVVDLRSDSAIALSRLDGLRAVSGNGDRKLIAQTANDARLLRLSEQANSDADAATTFDLRLRSLLGQLDAEYLRSEQQMKAMEKSEQNFALKIDQQSSDLVELQQLQREAEATRLLYESFLARLKETTVQQGLQIPDSRLLSEAVPRPKSSPRSSMILALSVMLGAMLGTGLVLLKELRNNTIRTADELENITGHSVLGTIPKVSSKNRAGVLSYARLKPTSSFAEAVRNLRTSVLLSNPDKQPQVIMSTSSVAGEGKTIQSLTLAQNMAGLGKRVIVVECDIRKRVFSEYFDIKDKVGFLAVLTGEVDLKDAIMQHDDMGIDILIGEKSNLNAADIFSSEKFAQFIAMLRKNYDFIIIDTPPVLAVPDARIIGQHVDAIIYSVLWDSTTKTQVKQGLGMLSSVGLNVSGLVLSNVDSKKMKRSGYGGQYGYYAAEGYYEN